MSEDDVEFNNGFVTALALFYGHSGDRTLPPDLKIYVASDHLLNIDYPENLSPELKKKVKSFVSKALEYRCARKTPSEEDLEKLFDECIEILKDLDREFFGLDNVVVNYP